MQNCDLEQPTLRLRSLIAAMSVDEKFLGLVDSIEQVAFDDRQGVLEKIAQSYGLSHVAYLGLHLPRLTEKEPLVCVTYPESWIAHYRAKNYIQIDPVIHESLNSLLPSDWKDYPQQSKRIRNFFGEAKEFGLGSNGITFSIRGCAGETALFSIACDASDKEWAEFKKMNLPNFQMLGFYIHQMIMRSVNAEIPNVKLSPREIECLKWAANGKTFADIGEILSLSERTVRFYLDIARHKLNCINITHAVARAMIMHIIPPPS
jgi:DNA-binding CsgD family transcriptional regulator